MKKLIFIIGIIFFSCQEEKINPCNVIVTETMDGFIMNGQHFNKENVKHFSVLICPEIRVEKDGKIYLYLPPKSILDK